MGSRHAYAKPFGNLGRGQITVFGTQGMPLMDMVLRSFIVFIAVVLGQTAIFVMVASMKTKKVPAGKGHEEHHRAAPAAAETPAKQTGTPS